MSEREIIICSDIDELNVRAAEQFLSLVHGAMRQSRPFTVALSGGSTPKSLYSLLAREPYRDRIDWSGVHLFWGDERCVPPDHQESNFRMVREALLSKIQIPAANIHRMEGEKAPETAAADYENELRTFFRSTVPRFDMILLGLGEDGHTASLFPGTEALNEQKSLVTTTYVQQLKAHRLTLTFPVINAATQILFLVSGRSKAAVAKQILSAHSHAGDYPAARVRPLNGRVTWLITRDAAGQLSV